MSDVGQNWELFGYDMRQLGRHWFAAWHDLLWADESPVRQRLGDVVQLHSDDGDILYQAGRPSAPAPFECEAILLPDELVLTRMLRLPASAEAHLESVITMEVAANSPFAANDTGFGWQLMVREGDHLTVALGIVSISTVMAYLVRAHDRHDPAAQEIWARVDDRMLLLRGFGEKKREANYRRRLLRCGAGVLVCATIFALILGVAAGAKRVQLSQVNTLAASALREAAQASQMRASLAQANETIAAVNAVVALYP
ncbi:MAG: hypothetical protein V7700_19030, partial [Halioglobus sp.]